MQTSTNGSSPQDVVQSLRQSLEKTFEQNRALLAEMARFTRTEPLRMAQRQLGYTHRALARFEDRRDLVGLIGAQQEWIREMAREYATQGLCYAEMFCGFTRNVHHQAGRAAQDFAVQAEETAKEVGEENETIMHEVQRAAE